MKSIVWAPTALADLGEIRHYVGRFNPPAAREFATRTINASNSLKRFYARGRPVGDNVREWALIYPYMMRYQVMAEEVHILGIRHDTRLTKTQAQKFMDQLRSAITGG